MKSTVTIDIICQHYEIEPGFVKRLNDLGMIEFVSDGNMLCLEASQIRQIDKIVRLHDELDINPEGIDVVFNLLQKIKHLEQALLSAENKLSVLESLLEQKL
jgi:hypothetical protein